MARVRQAGAIAVRNDSGDPKILLVTAKKNPTQWIFPKGHIDPGETAEAAALRELREEAGVEGEIVRPVGTLSFPSGDEEVDVAYYLVRCLRNVAGREPRRLRWLPVKQARAALTFADARDLLDAAVSALEAP